LAAPWRPSWWHGRGIEFAGEVCDACAAQSLAFLLTLQQLPHMLAEAMIAFTESGGTQAFMLLSIAILVVMGSVLEGAAALIIFGSLWLPVAVRLGIEPLHFGVVPVIARGRGLFAPPLGLGLYGACLIDNVPIETTPVRRRVRCDRERRRRKP
jgi:TRAP-type C4-dicarboxylate transport system permease large subunit